MPVPIICLDEDVRHFAERFREMFSKPQYQYFVTVLLGLMLCEGARTLSGLLQQMAESPSLAGLSRFLSEVPWEEAAMAESWLRHFREEMQPLVEVEQPSHLAVLSRRRRRQGSLPGLRRPTGQQLVGRRLRLSGRHHQSALGEPLRRRRLLDRR